MIALLPFSLMRLCFHFSHQLQQQSSIFLELSHQDTYSRGLLLQGFLHRFLFTLKIIKYLSDVAHVSCFLCFFLFFLIICLSSFELPVLYASSCARESMGREGSCKEFFFYLLRLELPCAVLDHNSSPEIGTPSFSPYKLVPKFGKSLQFSEDTQYYCKWLQ